MKTVSAQEIAARAAQAAGQASDVGQSVLDAAISVMREELAAGNRVSLPNLLTLQMTPAGVVETQLEIPGAAAAAPGQVAVGVEPSLRAAVEAARIGHARILFVVPIKDMFIDIIAQRLGGEDATVQVVEGSQKAIQIFDEFKPDLVIVDGNLPDAEQVIRDVKLSPERGLIAVVVIYPEGVDPNLVKGLHVCEDEFLQEPYDIDDLAKLKATELQRVAEERNFFKQEVHFQFQTAEGWVEQANDMMAALADAAEMDEEKAAALSVAFREAVDNAARHGNKSQENRIIDGIYLLDNQKVTVTVEDEGDGFDTELYLTRGIEGNAVAAARERNQAGRVGGLGIMLMLKCLDDLEYNYVGNLVKLTKYR
ncbi:MAG: ATP-binding protein [Planctomycetota bacterium]|jgi:anti-sigma regulatory factor (Ser/Thr protein kinase)